MKYRPHSLRPDAAAVGRWNSPLIISTQRGQMNIISATSQTATILPVNVDNSLIRWMGFYNGGIDSRQMYPQLQLTNSTTVTALRIDASVNATTVMYEVTEFAPGVIRAIQRGTTVMTGNTTNTTITAVSSLAKTSIYFLGWRDPTGGVGTGFIYPTVALTTETNVRCETAVNTGQSIGWQVVEWN